MNNTAKIRYCSMDCLKGISCIAVVLIHYNFSNSLGDYIKVLCRFSVPIFFLISGFFMTSGKSQPISRKKTWKKAKHIIKLIIYSAIFYAIFCVIWQSLKNNGDFEIISFTKETISKSNTLRLLITNRPFVYAHLWFLLALVYCYVFSIIFFKDNKKCPKWVGPVTIILLTMYSLLAEFHHVANFLVASYVFADGEMMFYCHLFLFRALPFFLLGMVFREQETNIAQMQISRKSLFLVVIAGEILSAIEGTEFVVSQYYIGTYLVCIAMFVYAISYPADSIKCLEYLGKNLSLYVYILHIAVGKTLDLIATKYHLWNNQMLKYSRAFLVLGATIVISMIVFVIVKKVEKVLHKSVTI